MGQLNNLKIAFVVNVSVTTLFGRVPTVDSNYWIRLRYYLFLVLKRLFWLENKQAFYVIFHTAISE